MNTFVDKVIKKLNQNFGNDFRKVCVVFPTKRACLIFRKKLAETHDKPVFAPGILGIGDFVAKHVQVQVADEIPLLISLFEAYKKHWPEQDFGQFFGWGQMLINDFDEIDKHLSDPTRIFANISELRKIEAAFLPDAESLSWIHDFVSSFNTDKLTYLQNEFTKNWNRLSQLYTEFNQILDIKGQSYEGKAYREIISNLRNQTFTSKWDHFVFAGFYGFSRAEEEMIKLLGKRSNVTVLWDSDDYYISKKSHEAGYYFRKSSLFSNSTQGIENNFKNQSKKIEITAIPLQSGQAKYAGELLQNLSQDRAFDLHKTAIILPDENMLFPVLYSLPEALQPINVTMGYPLKQSQYVELIKILIDLHKHSKEGNDGKQLFYHRYITRFLEHPLLTGLTDHSFQTTTADHLNFLDFLQIKENFRFEASEQFFKPIASSKILFQYILDLLHTIQNIHLERKVEELHFEDTITGFIKSEISHLMTQLEEYIDQISVDTSWHLIRECIAGLKIPFSGEPVKGLQVMGFLETRALDFETIILLNMNEGTLPSATSAKSFIPYSLRKGFGLPTFEDQEASFAYHFYRLLHQSKNIYLLYNSEVSKTGGGEPSRYILQIRHELKKFMGDNLELSFSTVNTPIEQKQPMPITIPKSERLLSILNQYLDEHEGDRKRSFSSSAFNTYINCKLQYYFRYIANIKEKEEKEAQIADNVFGLIFHSALEKLYTGCDIVTESTIDKLLMKVDSEVEDAIKREYGASFLQLEGHDILVAGVIKELVKKVLLQDKTETPFTISELEGTYESTIKTSHGEVRLLGKFDRVDEVNGVYRIIDYKTGHIELKKSDVASLFNDSKLKPLFQLHFYAFIFKNNFPKKLFKTGFYVTKNIGSGILFPGKGELFQEDVLAEFSENLKILIEEIMDPAIDFSQTKDEKNCEFCPYKNICQR